MTNISYYIKKVRRNDDGQIIKVKASKTLEGKADKVRKRKKVVKHLKKGKNIKSSYLENGRWKEGDKIELHNDKWLTTEGNDEERDNLGNLKPF